MIYFSNPGEIDINAAMTLGVNAKEGESPIGQFGTGLKYAIAVLLRTEHKVAIWSGLTKYEFNSIEMETRGVKYYQVTMNGSPLGFTTALGKHWKVWQAFRELYSNTKDEGGTTSSVAKFPAENTTVIMVNGREINEAYAERGNYFIENKRPLTVDGSVEIYSGKNIFYRGILVKEVDTCFMYNLTAGVELTEDRTIGNEWSVQWSLAYVLARLHDPKFLNAILNSEKCAEHDFSWSDSFSNENKEVLRKAATHEICPRSSKDMRTL